MTRRYSRILGAAKYYSAIDNYIKYITDASKRGQNVGQGKKRPESTKLYIDPFDVKMAAGQRAVASGALPTWNQYKSIAAVSNRVTDQAPADTDLIITPEGWKAARISIKTGISDNGIVKTSKVTGLKYLSYGGTSSSLPFGRNDETETETAAFNTLVAAIEPTLSGNFDITYIPEKA